MTVPKIRIPAQRKVLFFISRARRVSMLLSTMAVKGFCEEHTQQT